MALSTSVDRGDAPVSLLPPSVSSEIWSLAQEQSVVMQRARRINLPAGGVEIPIITGDPTANFVAEGAEKPVSRGSLSVKSIRSYKIAVIEPFTMEFRRDLPALYNALRSRLSGALAKTFDQAALFGTGAPVTNGNGFDNLSAASAVNVASATAYDNFLTALDDVIGAKGDYDVTGWALAPKGEVLILGAKDGNGRPLFTTNPQSDGSIGAVLGRPVYKHKAVYKAGTVGTPGTPETIGFAGDWGTAVWGMVEGISIAVSDQATLTDGGEALNLWQRNMFAVRAEFEVGFALRDQAAPHFVRLTGETPTA